MTSKSVVIRDYHTEIPGSIVGNTWVFPAVRGSNAYGKEIEWIINVRAIRMPDQIPLADITENMFLELDKSLFDNKPLDRDVYGYTFVSSRVVGGKTRSTVPTITKVGKNLKSKSATNTFCQALRDALSKYNKQQRLPVSPCDNLKMYPPMLSAIFSKHPPTYPVAVQRKYNGVRAIVALDSQGVPIIYSRTMKPYYGFNEIRDESKRIIGSIDGAKIYIDGELYHHETPLQIISGMARRENNDAKAEGLIEYMIYDCFVPEKPNLLDIERRQILNATFKNANDQSPLVKCRLVETFIANDESRVQELYKEFLGEGYEGAMVRVNKPYDHAYNNRHSQFLLKLKETFDDEYEIINWSTGKKGKSVDSLMITCKTSNGKEFNVTPALTIEEREALASEMPRIEENGKTVFENKYLGAKLIVYFDEKSVDDVPQRGRTRMEIRTWD